MGKKGLVVFVFGLLSAAFLLFQWKEAAAACITECDYSSWNCGSCGADPVVSGRVFHA